jgi:flagellar FliL protein
MADSKQGAAPAPAAAQAPAKKGLPKKLIIIVAAALALCAGGAGAFIYLNKKPAAGAEAPKKEAQRKLPNFLDLDSFTVNLAEKDQDRYMQIKFSLEIGSTEAENTIKEMLPALRSEVLLVLSSRQATDLASREGKETLAKDIVAAANKALEHTPADHSVAAVHITQLIIQ